jgi:uncharacterized membrane protein
MMYGYGNGYGGQMGGGGWFFGLLFFGFAALILVGIVLLVIWAVRSSSDGHTGTGGGISGQPPRATPPAVAPQADEACTIARKRYASGEITKEQYEEICRTLGV